MRKEQAEDVLNEAECGYLQSARESRNEIIALENYSSLWDLLDARLGPKNDAVTYFVDEYAKTVYERLEDPQDSSRLGLMRDTFYIPRADIPDVVKNLLLKKFPLSI